MRVRIIIPLAFPLLAAVIIIIMVQPAGFAIEKMGGLGFAAALWIVGYALLRWAEKQNERILFGALIGGIFFRMVLVILSMFFVRSFTQMALMPYVVSLLIFYLACEFALVTDYAMRR